MDARVKLTRHRKLSIVYTKCITYFSLLLVIQISLLLLVQSYNCSLVRNPQKTWRKPQNSQCLLASQKATNTSENRSVKAQQESPQVDLQPSKPQNATKAPQANSLQQAELAKLINRSQHSVIIRYSSQQVAATTQTTRRINSTGTPQASNNNPQQLLFQQEPFESICQGWKTIVSGQYKSSIGTSNDGGGGDQESAGSTSWPYALWAFDRRRQALVAKFLFYERADLLEFSERLAILRSPLMPAIQKSPLIAQCKLRFASLMTISSHLEITLVELQLQAGNLRLSNRHFIKTIMESKQSRGAQLASKLGEWAAWQEQLIFLGRESHLPAEVFKRPYVIEITAMPGMITSGSTERQSVVAISNQQFYERPFLRGIALKNISFSDECFNLTPFDNLGANESSLIGIDATATSTTSFASSPLDELGSPSEQPLFSTNDDVNEINGRFTFQREQTSKSAFGRIWAYKVQIFCILGGSFLLIILVVHLVYARQTIISNKMMNHHYSMDCNNTINNNHRAINSNANNGGPLQPLGRSLCELACCARSIQGHQRIYPASNSKNNKPGKKVSNGKRRGSMGGVLRANKGGGARAPTNDERLNMIGSQESLDGNSRGVHACANWIDDIDLNDNPQYRSILMSQMKKFGTPLDVYSIDRKRITLTRLLGKGAFGQVYQGYLICFNSGDQLSELSDRPHHSSLESLGAEADDFYSRLDKMESRQRRLEYANCSQSREQLDSHSKPVAVKILTENGLKKIDFLLEAHSMSILSHRNIVGFVGVSFEEEPRYLVMEFLAGGNLKEFLIKNRSQQAEQPQARRELVTNDNVGNDDNLCENDNECDSIGGGGAALRLKAEQQALRASDSSLIISISDQTRAQHTHWSPANSPAFTENSFQMQKQSLSLNIGDLLVIALDIARACDYLQKRKIIHRDLAARNCLLSSSTKRYPSRGQLLPLTPTRELSVAFPAELQLPGMLNLSLASNGGRLSANSTERHFSGSRFLSSSSHQHQEQHHTNTFSFARPFHMGRASAGPAPSAADVDANHRIELDQVYTNGFCDSGIVAKLADFGMTREIEEHSDYYRSSSREMPIRWMPPEALNGITTNKSDVWSFGVLMWEIFSMGQLPYPDIHDNNQVYRMIRARAIAQKQPHSPSPASVPMANLNQTQNQNQQRRTTSGGASSTISGNQHQARAPSAAAPTIEKQLLLGNTTASSDMDDVSLHQASLDIRAREKEITVSNGETIAVASRSPRSPSAIFGPPLAPPYPELPAPIYSIMCACWANKPEERPQFEEIANRLYWCLQMPDVLRAPLPVFGSRGSRSRQSSQPQPTQRSHNNSDQWWAQ